MNEIAECKDILADVVLGSENECRPQRNNMSFFLFLLLVGSIIFLENFEIRNVKISNTFQGKPLLLFWNGTGFDKVSRPWTDW